MLQANLQDIMLAKDDSTFLNSSKAVVERRSESIAVELSYSQKA